MGDRHIYIYIMYIYIYASTYLYMGYSRVGNWAAPPSWVAKTSPDITSPVGIGPLDYVIFKYVLL